MWLEDFFGYTPPQNVVMVGRQIRDTVKEIGASALDAAAAAKTMAEAFDKAFGIVMGLDEANLHWKEGLAKLRKELEDGTKTLDTNTEAGQANVQALYDQARNAVDVYDSMIAAGKGADAATAAYNTNIDSIIAMATRAGFNRQQIQELIAKFKQVPGSVVTQMDLYGTDVVKTQIQLLKESLAGISGKTYTIKFKADLPAGISMGNLLHNDFRGRAFGGVIGAATGGIRSGLTWVGEMGKELVALPYGSRVYPHGESMRMQRQMTRGGDSSGAGGDPQLLAETRRTNALLEALRLTVGPEGLALTVRKGEKSLRYAG
jgi:hypothetical protein